MKLYPVQIVKVRSYERALVYRDGEFAGILRPGRHVLGDALRKLRVEVVNTRDVWLVRGDLDVIVKSGALGDEALVLDLKDTQRALVWIDGRIDCVLGRGLYVLWTVSRKVEVEIADSRELRLVRDDLAVIMNARNGASLMASYTVEEGHVGILTRDGRYVETLAPGVHVVWKGTGRVEMRAVDLRQIMLDVQGQEIMTADKVTLRMNAVVTYRVTDPVRAVTSVVDFSQAIYREAQFALRTAVGGRELDALLTGKGELAAEPEAQLKPKAEEYGVQVTGLNIRDIILPGEMKELMNRVIEAKKAAQANLITRQEETAAARSQVNTAKLLEANPTLMRLRELEVLEKVASANKMNIMLGEKGLTERVVNLL